MGSLKFIQLGYVNVNKAELFLKLIFLKLFSHLKATRGMLDLIDSMMTNPGKDDILEITDKNYQKIAETLEKVNSQKFLMMKFCLQMTSLLVWLPRGRH